MRIKFIDELDGEDVVELDLEASATIKRADMYRYQNMLAEKLEECGDDKLEKSKPITNTLEMGMMICGIKKEDVFRMIPFFMAQLDEFIFGE